MEEIASVTYIGHATTLIELDGVRILTDPFLRNRLGHLRRQVARPNPEWYTKLDLVLISHLHWDHFDAPSLRLLDALTRVVVPVGAGKLLQKLGFHEIEELAPGRSIKVGPLEVEATYALHTSYRLPFGPSGDSMGYLIRGTHEVYFAGDTDIFPGMAELAEQLDLALLPVWGWGPTLGEGHMDPQRAAEAAQILRPRLVVPIHWGTIYPLGLRWFRSHLLTDPPHAFAEAVGKLSPEIEVRVLPPGERSTLLARVPVASDEGG
jgi:L-ascorbate metabolism protein UlaG (beta-lactamase superfamily)